MPPQQERPARLPVDPEKAAKRNFVTRIGACAKKGDAQGAAAVFRELLASEVPCTPDMCSTLLHTFSAADTPMLEEASAVFAAVRMHGAVPDESAWSGYVKLRCAWGNAREALGHVDEMVEAGVAPRLRTYAPILSSTCA